MKLNTPIIARYDDAATIPTLLSAQNGMKCWLTIPLDERPQIINVEANNQKAGVFEALIKTLKLVETMLFPSSLGGSNKSVSPNGASFKSYGQSFENSKNNIADISPPTKVSKGRVSSQLLL